MWVGRIDNVSCHRRSHATQSLVGDYVVRVNVMKMRDLNAMTPKNYWKHTAYRATMLIPAALRILKRCDPDSYTRAKQYDDSRLNCLSVWYRVVNRRIPQVLRIHFRRTWWRYSERGNCKWRNWKRTAHRSRTVDGGIYRCYWQTIHSSRHIPKWNWRTRWKMHCAIFG